MPRPAPCITLIFAPLRPCSAAPFLTSHDDWVRAWLESAGARTLPRDVLLDLFEAALRAVWAQTSVTVGAVTLTAIARHVQRAAAERFPVLAALEVEPSGRIEARGLRASIDAIVPARLMEAMRYVLVEFLMELGKLTGDLLSPELHRALAAVAPRPSRAHARWPEVETRQPALAAR